MKVDVLGCAVCAPGLPDWADARATCSTGRRALRSRRWCASRRSSRCRRTSGGACRRPRALRWASAARRCEDARHRRRRRVATVFASCGSDGEIMHQICEGLARKPAGDLADALPQLGAQRARRLLEHRACQRMRRRRACARSRRRSPPGSSRPPRRRWPSRAPCCSSPTTCRILRRCRASGT